MAGRSGAGSVTRNLQKQKQKQKQKRKSPLLRDAQIRGLCSPYVVAAMLPQPALLPARSRCQSATDDEI
jgi:hypothetical protein